MESTDTSFLAENPLLKLKDAIEGAQQNSAKMLSMLEGFEKRLTQLNKKTTPIQEVKVFVCLMGKYSTISLSEYCDIS